MALTRNEVAQLYTPIYDEFMLESYSEETQKHQKIFQEIDDSTKTYDFHGLSGLGEWVDANEMASGGFEDPVLSYRKTFTQTKKWKKFQTSFESVDQDEYALLEKEDELSIRQLSIKTKSQWRTIKKALDTMKSLGVVKPFPLTITPLSSTITASVNVPPVSTPII